MAKPGAIVQRFTDQQKIRLAVSSWNLSGEDFGRFLRTNGLSSPEIEAWRQQMRDGLGDGKLMARQTKGTLENRIKLLEEENRQLRTLNEIQKKVQDILAAGEEAKAANKLEEKSSQPSTKASKKISPKD